MTTELVPRATVQAIVARRDRALELYQQAHDAFAAAGLALRAANDAAQDTCPGTTTFNYHTKEQKDFIGALKVPDAAAYMAAARRLLDTDVWAHLLQITNIERLMDKTAKEQFHRQLLDDPPEATLENLYATLEQFMLSADEIWKRGIAECFSKLDRRFRSHDGWKLGRRIILTRVFDDWGHFTYSSRVRDTLLDVERVFYLLDNREMPEYGGIVGVIERSRRDQNPGRMAGFQSECESEYFRAYAYINGNLHLWFKRDDLVTEVNKLLAEYYGEVLAHDNPDTDEGDLFSNRKTTPARRYGLFPTPDDAAEQLIQAAKLYRREEDPRLHVLEPSAGTGNLARRCAEKGAAVDCVEIQPHLAGQLQAEGKYRKVLSVDFLMLTPEPAYDKVVMNPPFDMERDIDHVMHAWGFLKDDGHLVAIMSAGTEFRETKKAGAFRKFVEKNGGRFRDLPPGSFRESGTNVNTVIVSIAKGRTPRWWHF